MARSCCWCSSRSSLSCTTRSRAEIIDGAAQQADAADEVRDGLRPARPSQLIRSVIWTHTPGRRMLEALGLVAFLETSGQAPKDLADLARASTHIVVIRISAFHDLPAQRMGTLLNEVIEATVTRSLKGPPLGATVFVPIDLW